MKEKIRADLKRYIVKQTSRAAADHAGDSGSLTGVPAGYLEDASGLKGGHAERLIVPADDEAVSRRSCARLRPREFR